MTANERIRQMNRHIRWSQLIERGMVIQIDGQPFAVELVTENYSTVTYMDAVGNTVTVDYGTQVEILGYFNP